MGWLSSGRGNYRAGVSTIGRGLNELEGPPLPAGRVRRKGGGRRALTSHDGTLLDDLRRIVEPATLGSPVRPLLWVSKSYEKLAAALRPHGPQGQRHQHQTIAAEAGLQSAVEPQ